MIYTELFDIYYWLKISSTLTEQLQLIMRLIFQIQLKGDMDFSFLSKPVAAMFLPTLAPTVKFNA